MFLILFQQKFQVKLFVLPCRSFVLPIFSFLVSPIHLLVLDFWLFVLFIPFCSYSEKKSRGNFFYVFLRNLLQMTLIFRQWKCIYYLFILLHCELRILFLIILHWREKKIKTKNSLCLYFHCAKLITTYGTIYTRDTYSLKTTMSEIRSYKTELENTKTTTIFHILSRSNQLRIRNYCICVRSARVNVCVCGWWCMCCIQIKYLYKSQQFHWLFRLIVVLCNRWHRVGPIRNIQLNQNFHEIF